MKRLIPQNIKNIYHLFQAILANLIYGFPSKNIKVIGVTGTNGKTTTVQMITKILEESGAKVAMASTINFKLGEKEWVNATKFTTLSSFKIQRFISEAVKNKCEYLVLETSSHSLDQFRTWGIKYDTAVITNITREHLDYHKTMEEYRQTKLKLFRNVKNAVVNLDMEKPEEFLKVKSPIKIGYSTKFSIFNFQFSNKSKLLNDKFKIIKAENIELEINNTKYQILDTKYQIQLPGLFNVENALAATCVGLIYEISPEVIRKALEKIQGVPGRMEKVPNDKGLEIIIDYAVTPDSLEKVYELISQSKKSDSKIISVFGACGERDRGKRPIMGEIVSKYADYIILTNEDPYNEDPMQIINEIKSGINICHSERSEESRANLDNAYSARSFTNAQDDIFFFTENVNFWIIMDRREAIKKALQLSKPGDIFVITGKGAEEMMAIGKKRIPWNEKKVILEEIEKIK
jgi:UDP-N-acetylmuramoyl-L-alanyl-D-glutamate--2,6-diaminopimelate ligase